MYVANGTVPETPVGLSYLSVLSRDSVIIAFLVAALNDLDLLACDISNAYLNVPCLERVWFISGLECGKSLECKVMKLVRTLYRLKISGASWRNIFKDQIVNCLGFTSCTIDPNMYYRRNTKEEGTDYYEVLLAYVEDGHTSRYEQFIGILRWSMELRRIDIQLEVALMSQYQMSPREGHLEALYLIFNFL